jgi:hypothetical protein
MFRPEDLPLIKAPKAPIGRRRRCYAAVFIATDFSIHPLKLSWIRRQKSGDPESKSPTLDFSKWGFAWAEFNPV